MRRQMVLAGPWSDPSTITSSVLKDLTSSRKVCAWSDWKSETHTNCPLQLYVLSISACAQLWIWEISHYLTDLRWSEQSKELQNLKNCFFPIIAGQTVYWKSSFWCCFPKELSNSLCANVDTFVPHQNFWSLLDAQRYRGLKYNNFLCILGK